ncbi:MAG: protein translocase subunit SecF [Mycobacteriales bacterium]
MSLATRLYRGEVSYDFLARRRRWYLISGTVVVISLISLFVQGLNLSIDFKGGDAFQFNANGRTVADAQRVLTDQGVTNAVVQKLSTLTQTQILVQTKPLAEAPLNRLQAGLASEFGITQDALNPQSVGASWGKQITDKAIEGLIIFLIAVVFYITLRFEAKMAGAAIVALVHDLIVTAGIYSLVGFQVTPATVIALLTILGFSLYDTVVVFDKVRENTAGLGAASRTTYSQAANLAVNQTLMRSINTSLIALLPVAALLFVGAGLLGAGTLKELALAQFVGLASGAYSSIFVATPILAQLKEREPGMQQLAVRVARTEAARPAASPGRSSRTGAAPEPLTGTTGTAVGLLDRPAGGSAGSGSDGAVGADGTVGTGGAVRRTPGSPMPRGAGASKRSKRGKAGRPSGKRKR